MSQDVFQQKTYRILEQIPGTIRLIDVVYRQTKEENDKNLRNPMKATGREGLCYNSNKCIVDQKEIHFFREKKYTSLVKYT